jgi:integrase
MSERRVNVWIQQFTNRKNLVLQWFDPDTGKRKSKSAETADPKKAEIARADLESDLNHGRHKEASRISWERFRELFEDERLPGMRQSTVRNFGNTFDLLERICHPTSLRSIDARTLSQFKAGLMKLPGRRRGSESMLPSTIAVRLTYLRSALAWALEQKMIHEMPTFPSVKVPKKDPQPVPAESFEKLLTKADDAEMRAFLLCGWLAGLRLNEALQMEREANDRVPYLDLLHDRIVIPAEFAKAVRDQWVPLDPDLRAALEALPEHGARVFDFRGPDGCPIGPTAIGMRVIKLAQLAGVRITMKTLRRGFACYHAARQPAQVLQKLMRHANIATTMAYYSNVDSAVEAAVANGRQSGVAPSVAVDANCDPV